LLDDLGDPRCGFAWNFMRPDPHHPPPVGEQARVSIAITLLVGEDLRAPKFGILLGPRRVLRAWSSRRRADSADVFFCRTRFIRGLASGDDGAARALATIPSPPLTRRRRELADVLLHVFNDGLTDCPTKIDGHGVTDKASNDLELNRFVLRRKRIVLREALKNCALSK
jgi:hypothetical protein